MRSLLRSPLKAIRAKCLNCQANQYKEVRNCDSPQCSLWHFRFGKMPETVIKKEGEKGMALFRHEDQQNAEISTEIGKELSGKP